jgi:elongation factor 2
VAINSDEEGDQDECSGGVYEADWNETNILKVQQNGGAAVTPGQCHGARPSTSKLKRDRKRAEAKARFHERNSTGTSLKSVAPIASPEILTVDSKANVVFQERTGMDAAIKLVTPVISPKARTIDATSSANEPATSVHAIVDTAGEALVDTVLENDDGMDAVAVGSMSVDNEPCGDEKVTASAAVPDNDTAPTNDALEESTNLSMYEGVVSEEHEVLALPEAMNEASELRNLAIIAHVDHGKTTLADCLIAATGQLNTQRAGVACVLDKGLEAERGITIYSAAVALRFPDRKLTINLVDCPGHAEFNSEVSCALRLTDGAFLLVDAKEGVMPQTKVVLQQALAEGVQPVLVLNKFDKLLPDTYSQLAQCPALSSQQSTRSTRGEKDSACLEVLTSIYKQMQEVISQVNSVIVAHNANGGLVANEVSLESGTVCIGSAKQGWMTTLSSFAKLYGANKLTSAEREATSEKVRRLLCGARSEQHVVRMVLQPLAELHALAGDLETHELDVKLQKMSDHRLSLPKHMLMSRDVQQLRRAVLSLLLPAATTLLDLASVHVPSPGASQRLRASSLCEPSANAGKGKWQQAICACDPDGPLVLFASKMVPVPHSKTHAALCRVFSGTVHPGDEVYVLQASCDAAKSQVLKGRVSRVLRLEACSDPSSMHAASAGNICALVGFEKILPRAGTLADVSSAPPLRELTLRVSAVERRAISVPSGIATRKLAEALPLLLRGDPLVKCRFDEDTCETVLAGAGILHLETCLHRLRELMGPSGKELQVEFASVAHRETVVGSTPRTELKPGRLGKTTNKHNRFWFVVSSLGDELINAMESGAIGAKDDNISRVLVHDHDWESKHAQRILSFGPGPNVLVDTTVGVQGIDGVAEHLIKAFSQLCASGPLCGVRLRGVRIDIIDAKIHPVAAQRRANEVVPAAKRGMEAAILDADPSLLEPLHTVTLVAPLASIGEVYNEITARRGVNISHEYVSNERNLNEVLCTITGDVPLVETSGLSEKLNERMRGNVGALSMKFSWWNVLDGEPWRKDSGLAGRAVAMIRDRRGLRGDPPSANDVGDRL